MIPRYTTEMADLFTDEAAWGAALQVEKAAVSARWRLGQVPDDDYRALEGRWPTITPEVVVAIQEREATTDHDVAAFVDVVQEVIDHLASRWVHYGLTSSDVTDTALCLRLAQATDLLIQGAEKLLAVLCRRAREFETTKTAGRTHGQHAEIITFGIRLANYACMVDRAITTLRQARDEIAVGKLSGACGTYSNIDPRVEKSVCDWLDLTPTVATQVVPRDLHANLIYACARLGNAIGHIFFNERMMATTEFGEVEEARRPGAKGSSAMPHKRNTIRGEQLCGLARLLRSYVGASMENVELLFERDISHSAPERIYLPDALIVAHHMVLTASKVMDWLIVKTDAMAANIERSLGLMFTQTVLTALIEMGWERDEAYRLVQDMSNKAWDEKRHLRELLEASDDLDLTAQQLDGIFNEARFFANIRIIMERLPR